MPFPNQSKRSAWKPSALVIDTDADIHRSIHVMLGKDYDVHHAYFPRLALSLLEKRRFNVVLTSTDLGNADEMPELHRTIASVSRDKGIPVISLSDGMTGSQNKPGYVRKPLEGERILKALRLALAGSASS